METGARIGGGIVTILLGVWFNFLFMPTWNITSPGLWLYFIVMLAVAAIIFFAIESFIDEEYWGSIISGIALLAILLIFFLCSIPSWELVSSNAYHGVIEIEQGEFKRDVPEISEDSFLPVIDMVSAQKVGDRTAGNIKNASWYEVDDEYNLIRYKGEYYRISPLLYGGLFKYGKAKNTGIPGYVLVNAKTQEAEYVELELPIKYSPSAHYGYLLDRHLRNEYPSYMFSKSFFEIDEEGNPFYITGIVEHTIGIFGGDKIERFVITNATTGQSVVYHYSELPEWVDQAYSIEYLMQLVKWHQSYIHGYWNNVGSKTDVNRTTYDYMMSGGYNTVIDADGEIMLYTGVTPASSAESNIGFILVNPRTAEVKYYPCTGAEESSAQAAAEGLVSDLKYMATFPTVLNVDGEETYFMFLKDGAGLVQRYAFCSVKNYTKVVQAETLEKALKQYRGTLVEISPEMTVETSGEGVISAIYTAEIEGYTYFYFTLEGSENLYMSSITNSNRQVILSVGTKVKISYVSSTEEGVYMVKKIEF